MQFALAARGYTIMPWNESAQMHDNKETPLSGPKDAAFRHYSGPVGKPTYVGSSENLSKNTCSHTALPAGAEVGKRGQQTCKGTSIKVPGEGSKLSSLLQFPTLCAAMGLPQVYKLFTFRVLRAFAEKISSQLSKGTLPSRHWQFVRARKVTSKLCHDHCCPGGFH
eukprot:symbB.v1.2.018938.t1/scaffold1487.1/size223630/8